MTFHRQQRSMSLRGSKIFLVGMPGSGKSTMAKLLSERLGLPFVDLDEQIVSRAGTSIKEIFARYGESYFRQLEHEALLDISAAHEPVVIATGGGTPCFYDNMDIIKRSGISIFLDVSLQEIERRMNAYEKDQRPKFPAGEELGDLLAALIEKRLPFYEQADYRWTGKEPVEELLNNLKVKWPPND